MLKCKPLPAAGLVVSFTGSQFGMTSKQAATLLDLFVNIKPCLFVHGDCVGADSQAHDAAMALEIPIKIRPCDIEPKRAYCSGAIEVTPIRRPLERNRDIVSDCSVLVATPAGSEEELRSGTWATVRYAKKAEKRVIVIWPSGDAVDWSFGDIEARA